ncbi:Anaphase-promoting complex subunit 4 [Aphelenchoides fujianensis]|nr:Anaphase-promoting complex subunit 4 [Aphelenchoides fujianensis]
MNDLDAGITHDRYEYRTKFKVKQALWNPQLDVLALASADGEICLKRYHWKNGWKKKIAAEPLFFNKWSRSIYGGSQENAGPFASMCWSPCGRVLAVAFEEGVCHLLEVNDALILYSLRVSTAKKCEHLRTKDSENNRDHYKVVFGVQEFCHSLVQKSLLGTSLVVVAETPDGVAFHVYSGGCFLVRTVLFDESFMNDRFDKSSLEVRDLVVLPNGRLQFAVSASAHHVPRFDRTAGYAPPADPTEEAYGECTFLLDYDVGFGNAEWMRATAKLAVRSCHIFHLLTAFRETFFRTCSEWETVSEQFHNNVFGSLYEKYREETKGQVADFALDFMAYILTGSSAEAFARAFFKDIKPKDWKPARDFVVKHIPNFLQSINRHLHPLVDALFVHLTCLQGELQQFERQCTYGWGAERRMSLELLNEMKQMEKSAPLRQIERTIFGIRHLGAIVKRLGDVAHTNWAELKYVLQLLSSHPDNEQLEMDIEDDCDGIPRQVDYEVLLKFIVNALVDPSKRHLLENPMELISEWQQRLAAGDRAGSAESLLCNPNWLKHRVFDKIAPLLGTCPEIPVPTDWPRKKDADDPMDERAAERAECRATSTVTDALRWCFNSIEDVYLSGTTQLHNANPQLMPVRTACLEYCHPEAVGKLRLFNWNELKRPHRSMPAEEAAVCLRAMGEFEEKLGASCQSLVMVCRLRLPRRSIDADETERKFAATVQLFVSADSADPLPLELASACSPDSIARLFAFGEMHECTKGMTDTNAEKLAAAFEANEIHVLDAEMYGGGALHLLCTPCESPGGANGRETPPSSTAQSNGFPVHILRVDVCGNLRKIEATPLTYCADPLLLTAPGRAVGVLFERKFETVKWFELEAPAESRSLLSKAVLATPREREMSALSDLTPRKTPAGFRAQTPPASSTGRPAPYSRPSAQRRRRVPPATAQRLSFTLPASQTTPATSRDEEAPPSWRNAATPTSTGRHPRLQRLADGEVLNIPSPVASTITVSYDSSFPPSNESSRPSSPQAAAGSSTATRTAPRRSTRRRFTAELVISDGAEASTATEQPPAADVNDNELPNAQWEQEQMRAMLENLDAQTEAAARAIATVISANSDPIDRPIPTHIRRPTADSGSSARTAVTREQIYGRRHTRPQQPAASTSAATPSTSRSGGSRSKATSGSPPALRRSQRRARATTSAATNTSPLPSASASTSRLNSFFDELEREAGPPPITPARSRRPDESDDERDVQDIVDSFFDPDGQ